MQGDSSRSRSTRLGEVLIMNGWITWEQLEKALEIQQRSNESISGALVAGGSVSKKEGQLLQLGEILIQNKLLTWDQLTEGLKIQKVSGKMIGEILIERGFITSKNLHRALAIQHNKTFVDFDKIKVSAEAVKLVPKPVALEYVVMPLAAQEHRLLVAVANPTDVKFESGMSKRLPLYLIQSAIACPREIKMAIQKNYAESA